MTANQPQQPQLPAGAQVAHFAARPHITEALPTGLWLDGSTPVTIHWSSAPVIDGAGQRSHIVHITRADATQAAAAKAARQAWVAANPAPASAPRLSAAERRRIARERA